METTISQLTPVEYAFDLTASAEDLAPSIDKEMRRHRSGLTLKGFRPGRVPLTLIKKMYGKAIALEVVERTIQEKFEAEVVGKDEYDVFGSPLMETLEYKPFEDLHAVIEFGIKPEVELKDLSGEEIVRVTHEVDEKELDEEMEDHRKRHSEVVPHEDPAGEEDIVQCNIQRLDFATETPVVGEKQENVPIALGNPETLPELKTALAGVKAGDVVKATLPPPESEVAETEFRKYELTVTEVQKRVLPELDEAFFEHASSGQVKTLEEFKPWLNEQLESRWQQAIREDFESGVVKAINRLHDFEIPKAAVNTYLDRYVADLKQQSKELPEDFDENAFRESQRQSAEDSVRWELIRDKIVEEQELTISPADLDAEFEEMGKARDVAGDVMRRVFEAYNPGGVGQLERQLQDKKVFAYLASEFDVVDKPFEEVYGDDEEGNDN